MPGHTVQAYHTTLDPVASVRVSRAHNKSQGSGEEDLQLLAKMARPIAGSLTSVALYGANNILQFPINGLAEKFLVSHLVQRIQGPESGISWEPGLNWQEMECSSSSGLPLIRSVATGRVGLGYFLETRVVTFQGKEWQCLVQEEVYQTFTSEAKLKHPHVLVVLDEDLWNTSKLSNLL